MSESVRIVPAFGARVGLRASGLGRNGLAAQAALVLADGHLRRIHATLTPFEPASELSRLNADGAPVVLVSSLLARLCAAVHLAGRLSQGLVDATLGSRVPGGRAWRSVVVDRGRSAVLRPPGVVVDPCGLAKGMAADLVAARLAGHPSYVVDCLGDLRVGGTACRPRPVRVADPVGGAEAVTTLIVRDGAVATSGTTRRADQLIDPRTGEPADTGVLQATALASTGLEAEVRAKAALLAGPQGARRHLPYGGVLVLASGAVVELGVPAAPARAGATARPAVAA